MGHQSKTLWNDLAVGIDRAGTTIRHARAKDRRVAQQLLRLAVEAPTVDGICDRAGDLGSLVAAYHRRDRASVQMFWGRNPGTSDVVLAGSVLLVAESSAGVIGAICVAAPWRIFAEAASDARATAAVATIAKLAAVGVSPGHRGNGVGRALIDLATDLFDEAGYGVVVGQCSSELRPFYERAGYSTVDPGAYIMIWEGSAAYHGLNSDDPDECMFGRILNPVSVEGFAWRAPHLADGWWTPTPTPVPTSAQDSQAPHRPTEPDVLDTAARLSRWSALRARLFGR